MARPSVSVVKDWQVVYSSAEVEVRVGSAVFQQDYWLVIDKKSKKKKYFYGEQAWGAARRLASDLDFGAWSI
jgi:hypothetical protein